MFVTDKPRTKEETKALIQIGVRLREEKKKKEEQDRIDASMNMQVGDLVEVTSNDWGDSIPQGAVGIVIGFEKRLHIPAVTVIINNEECWIDQDDLKILSKAGG